MENTDVSFQMHHKTGESLQKRGSVKCGKLPDAITLLHLLKDCRKTKDLQRGSRLYADILNRDLLQKDIYLAGTLVDMYAKCGALGKAQEVFDGLPMKNVVCWNALITGYTQQGAGHTALTCFEEMQSRGFSPDAVTFASIMKACGNIGATEKGEEVHAKVATQGLLEHDVLLGTALVDMYAKCGKLAKAQEVFDVVLIRDVVTWNALIAGYVQHEHWKEAFSYFDQIPLEGLSPNGATLGCMVKACSTTRATEKGTQLHLQILKSGWFQKDSFLGNALVDMYAKCGALAKAQHLFCELPVQDIVCYNALIGGYAQHGHDKEAIECFERIHLEGIFPDAVTFASILKACDTVEMGEHIHAEIVSGRVLEKNISLGTALLDMYIKCGALDQAQLLFEELLIRDVICWNVLIRGYAQQGHCEVALDSFKMMQREGLCPDAVTYACILKACGNLGVLETGDKIHARIVTEENMEIDAFVATSLVEMYARGGLIKKAQQAFDRLHVQNVVSWTVLIGGYTQNGYGDEAMKCLRQMEAEGFCPDAVTLASIASACSTVGRVESGHEVLSTVVRWDLLGNDVVFDSSLIIMHAKFGALAKAQQVFDNAADRDVVCWNSLICGYVRHGHNEEALSCFEHMQCEGLCPDETTIICIMKACGSIGAIERGGEIHAKIIHKKLLETSSLVGNALVDMYAKCGALGQAQEVFDELSAHGIECWNALIAGYAQHAMGTEAWNVFQRMQGEGFIPNVLTLTCIVHVCGMTGDLDKGREVHSKLVMEDLQEKDISLDCALINMYAKCGAFERAEEVFDDLPFCNVICWNALITGYTQHRLCDEALYCFEQMQHDGLCPDVITLACIVKACSILGAADMGREINERITTEGFMQHNVPLGTALIDMYSKCGLITFSEELFDKLPYRDVVSWNVLMAGYAYLGRGKDVFESFYKMIGECIDPDQVTFVVLFYACSHSALLEEAQMHFIAMKSYYGIIPSLQHHTCMVDLFGRAGQLHKAVAVIMDIPSCNYLPLWSVLLTSCQKCRNLIISQVAFERALQLDVMCMPLYITMSNVNNCWNAREFGYN